jgi:hypothetical protein
VQSAGESEPWAQSDGRKGVASHVRVSSVVERLLGEFMIMGKDVLSFFAVRGSFSKTELLNRRC